MSAATAILCISIGWLWGAVFGWIMGEWREERERNAEWWAARQGEDT